MPLFEVETENHILITWAEDGDAASTVVGDAYPQEHVIRLTKRPRDTWVISKSVLGITGHMDICHTARDCLLREPQRCCIMIGFHLFHTPMNGVFPCCRTLRCCSWNC